MTGTVVPRHLTRMERRVTELALPDMLVVDFYLWDATSVRSVYAMLPKDEPPLPKGYVSTSIVRRLFRDGILEKGKLIAGSDQFLATLTSHGLECHLRTLAKAPDVITGTPPNAEPITEGGHGGE